MTTFRVHGDNIVECERIANIIINETSPSSTIISLLSPSTITVQLEFNYLNTEYRWNLDLLPGFNKAGRSRWESDIFTALKDNGSFLSETPDAIVTKVEGDQEIILFAIEFCSALQAGNQAWQRSGRAFSTGRTGCPYIYIVDFVKYELDSKTRARKALRFPNPVVPYSYYYYSQTSDNFVAQVYVQSEEFDKSTDNKLINFDEDNFGDADLSKYIVKKMCGLDTSEEENRLLEKNMNVVQFLANESRPQYNLTCEEWGHVSEEGSNIIEYCVNNAKFNFHKTITAKGHHGKSPEMLSLIDNYSVGLASRDLPFGIIPHTNRDSFGLALSKLYPDYNVDIIHDIRFGKEDLILCLIKGFKPRGDDNRPDRGILPLVNMLSTPNVEILTYIYGPVLSRNYSMLLDTPKQLANSNGFWKSVLALSDYVALDVPIIQPSSDASILLNTKELKKYYTALTQSDPYQLLSSPLFSSIPTEYHEDDVDTGVHFLFKYILNEHAFEGMCNPPGGDWSGFSVIDHGMEKRWLSLPRVSDAVNGKRPDHIIEIFNLFEKPALLSIESKERSSDLEPEVGLKLSNYIRALMSYVPNVEREAGSTSNADWKKATSKANCNDFVIISAAAYLKSSAGSNESVFRNSKCDILFIMTPQDKGWIIELIPYTEEAEQLKRFINQLVVSHPSSQIIIA